MWWLWFGREGGGYWCWWFGADAVASAGGWVLVVGVLVVGGAGGWALVVGCWWCNKLLVVVVSEGRGGWRLLVLVGDGAGLLGVGGW